MDRPPPPQEEIDRLYNPRLGVPDVAGIVRGWNARSARTRATLPARLGEPYGPTLAETVDVFPAREPGSPVHLFLHGGYWRAFSSRDFSFVAEAAAARGWATVVVDHALCPRVTLPEIVRQARAALAWTWRNAERFGGDRERILVSGHSAGGHLAARLLATPWERDYGLPAAPIRAALPLSGLFDLEPLRWSWLQPVLQLTGETILAESPLRHPPSVPVPVAVAVGGAESAAFRDQSGGYARMLRAAGLAADLIEVPGRDHFAVLDELAAPEGVLWSRLAALAER